MRERPILFSGPMVRAILDGTKTQTRRVVKPQPVNVPVGAYCNPYNKNYEHFTFWTSDNKMCNGQVGNVKNTCHWKCPYGAPGSRLWVREAWKVLAFSGRNLDKENQIYEYTIGYRATKDLGPEDLSSQTILFKSPRKAYRKPDAWRPSIHMPREYSRILLEVVNVRVERLQDISEEDAKAEGATPSDALLTGEFSGLKRVAYRLEYKNLWNRINGPGSWDANPWVWVVEFRRVKP